MSISDVVDKASLNLATKEIDLGREDPHKKYPPIIVLIGGGSCSGKSLLARGFVNKLGEGIEGVVISMDDFYLGSREMRLKGIGENYDDIRAFDIPYIRRVLRDLRAGHRVVKPTYNFEGHDVVEYEVVERKDVIVFEGLYALHPWLVEFGHVGMFVKCKRRLMLERRRIRDESERGCTKSETNRLFFKFVLPMYRKHVEPTIERADIRVDVVDQDFVPSLNFDKLVS